MKKRIGSKLYDTETSELVCEIDGGRLYRKCTRDRGWFAVYDDGSLRPLDVYDPRDIALMETGHTFVESSERERTNISVDRETHSRIAAAAKNAGLPMSLFLKKISESL